MRLPLGDSFSKEQRIVLAVVIFFGIILLILWLSLLLAGGSIAQAVLNGGALEHLRRAAARILIGVPPENYQQALLEKIFQITGRITLIFAGCAGLVLFGSMRRPHLLRDFFSAESHPLNLAILRIFYFLTVYPRVNLRSVIELSQLPPKMRVVPPGLGWFSALLPQSASTITALHLLFLLSCIMGAIGFRTRLACIVTTVLSFYFIGVPQLFGKIDHLHHIIWIGALLSVSRCSDVLSVDSVLAACRRRKLAGAPVSSLTYGVPLRFVWLFLGIIYFFPGFWKYVVSGNDWFMSENLQNRMLLRLFFSEGWQPIVRMDQFPTLCKLGGLTTIVMEMAFIFLVFLPGGRYVAAAGGLLFHWLVKLFLNISFWPIQVYYVAFFDCRSLLQRLGALIYRHPLEVRFNADSGAHRLVLAAQSLDLFGQVNYRVSQDAAELSITHSEGTELVGRSALLRLAKYVPLLYLFFPLLLFRSKGIVELIPRRASLRGVYAVGTIVILLNALCGFTLVDTWPIGVYPTFATLVDQTTVYSMVMSPLDPEDKPLAKIELQYDPAIRNVFPRDRLPYAIREIARLKGNRQERLMVMWNIWHNEHPEMQGITRVAFFIAEYSTQPEDADRNPIRLQLMEVVTVPPSTPSAPQP